jgi:hypothetical protein
VYRFVIWLARRLRPADRSAPPGDIMTMRTADGLTGQRWPGCCPAASSADCG